MFSYIELRDSFRRLRLINYYSIRANRYEFATKNNVSCCASGFVSKILRLIQPIYTYFSSGENFGREERKEGRGGRNGRRCVEAMRDCVPAVRP